MSERGFQRALAAAALCGAVAIGLQGCVGLLFGGALTGAMAAADRRTLGAQTEDKAIIVKGEARMQQLFGDDAHINVTSYNRRVLLTGEVKDDAMKQSAEREAKALDNVASVIDELEIAGPSSLTARSSDALLTGKVKAALVDNKQISTSLVKVVSERGAVYLMGLVSDREGAIAAEVARGVGGVQKVVKVFEYIPQEEAEKFAAPQPAAK
jgi:osmotically-inducible protein OsmY